MCGQQLLGLVCLMCPLLAVKGHGLHANPPVVQVTGGSVQGSWTAEPVTPGDGLDGTHSAAVLTMAAFRGIPYGAAPVGRQGRWKPPRMHPGWNDTFNATASGPSCFQLAASSSSANALQGQSEDCLNLDVFSSNLPNKTGNATATPVPVPVLVWIYGGSLIIGSTTSYGAIERIVALSGGKVMLVAMNYRLASLGFLAYRGLVPEDPRGTTGNYGLLDIQLALQWVQKNAHVFGGDASRVTVIGQSSGGTAILALLASRASRGLFHAAISLSGSPNITMDLEQAEALQFPLVESVGCNRSSVEATTDCLYALSPEELSTHTPASWDPPTFFPAVPTGNNNVGLPVVDGVTITEPVLSALEHGLVDVPLLLQSMQDEDDFFVSSTNPQLHYNASQFHAYLRTHFAAWSEGTRVGDALFGLYGARAALGHGRAFFDLDADVGVSCGQIALAIAAGKGFRSPVYLSQVAQSPSHPFPWPGLAASTLPFHTWDFQTGFDVWWNPLWTPQQADLSLGVLLRSQWLALAEEGHLTSFPAVTSAPDFPTHWYTGVQGKDVAGRVARVLDYRGPACSLLPELDLDQRFWWVN